MSHGHGGHGHHRAPQPVIIQLLPWHWITNLFGWLFVGIVLLALWAWLGTWGLLLLIFGPPFVWACAKEALRIKRENDQSTWWGKTWSDRWTK